MTLSQTKTADQVEANLRRFEELDFEAFNKQNWELFTGTFSRPMMLPDGTSMQSTGKSFKIPMCTIALWKDGRIAEETLFWYTGAMMQQIEAAK